jgi:hypothetical protein
LIIKEGAIFFFIISQEICLLLSHSTRNSKRNPEQHSEKSWPPFRGSGKSFIKSERFVETKKFKKELGELVFPKKQLPV